MTAAAPTVKPVSEDFLRSILDLYERGLALQAYERGKTHGPLAAWRSGGTTSLTSICRCGACRIHRNRCGSRSDRCVSLAVALLTFAFWLDRPAT